MYDLIIIGAGPAGMSAAVYGTRAGLQTLVIEKNPMGGGQVLTTYEVDNYLGLPGINGFDMGQKFQQHAKAAGAEFVTTNVTGLEDMGDKKIVHTEKGDFEAKTVVWAAGAHHAHLNVPGEEELAGMGVSYCATCDGAFFRGKKVAVVGGGDVAVEDAVFLARFCEAVYLIHRRDTLRAAKSLQEKLFELPNVKLLWNRKVKEIQGEDMVESLCLENSLTGEEESLAVNGVFIAVGILPDTKEVRELVACNEAGYIIAGEDCRSSVSGIYVAGDARQKPMRQIITAVADGANAATSASLDLMKQKKEG